MEILNPPGFADLTLGAPADWDEAKKGPCHGLPVRMIDGALVSLWKPTKEELFHLNQGQPIALYVHSKVHPPVSMAVTLPEKEVEGRA